MKQKERWVYVAKCVAILAVITDHCAGRLYFSAKLQHVSFFSVTLFILLMGITTYWSYDNTVVPIWKKIIKRISGIVIPYIIAVFVYQLIASREFIWDVFWGHIVHFNASGPHYYVLLYVQLLLVSPMIFYLIKSLERKNRTKRIVVELMFGGGVLIVSRFSNLHSNIMDIYAGKLFGGSYLLVLFIGMLVGKNKQKLDITLKSKWVLLVSFLLLSIMAGVIFTKDFLFDACDILGSVINPPGVTLLIYAITVLLCIFCWDSFVLSSGWNIVNGFENIEAYIGEHTLYIFLYHRLLLDYFLDRNFGSIHLGFKVPIYFLTMIIGSLVIESIVGICKGFIERSYLYRKEL